MMPLAMGGPYGRWRVKASAKQQRLMLACARTAATSSTGGTMARNGPLVLLGPSSACCFGGCGSQTVTLRLALVSAQVASVFPSRSVPLPIGL
jgi:hypothetical protein